MRELAPELLATARTQRWRPEELLATLVMDKSARAGLAAFSRSGKGQADERPDWIVFPDREIIRLRPPDPVSFSRTG